MIFGKELLGSVFGLSKMPVLPDHIFLEALLSFTSLAVLT